MPTLDEMLPDIVVEAGSLTLTFVAGWFIGWFIFFRENSRFVSGESDDILFQAHYLIELDGPFVQLVFRNVAAKLTVNQLYDNPAALEYIKELKEKTTLEDPILPTKGTAGFEILNDAANYISGALATSSFDKQVLLFCMTCEDREVVRRKCIRCFIIKPQDLKRFSNWNWVKSHVRTEKPWHWVRLLALHNVAKTFEVETSRFERIESAQAQPLVDDQVEHRKVIYLSLGLPASEIAVRQPYVVDWSQYEQTLTEDYGVTLEGVSK